MVQLHAESALAPADSRRRKTGHVRVLILHRATLQTLQRLGNRSINAGVFDGSRCIEARRFQRAVKSRFNKPCSLLAHHLILLCDAPTRPNGLAVRPPA